MASPSSAFTLDPLNARKHGPRSREAIARSLRDLGAGRSIVVDSDGVIVAGNGVYEQAHVLGIPVRVIETAGDELVVVHRTDLSTDDDRRKALALADNRLGELSEWDEDRLAAARALLDSDLLAATALPDVQDVPPPSAVDLPPADGIRFSFGGHRTDLAEATYRKIIDSIPNNGNAQAVVDELRRRIGL